MPRFRPPLDDYIITRGFYYLSSIYVGGQHAAVDLIRATVTTTGSPIRVVADGTVVGVGWDRYSGFFVAVDHVGGWRSTYRHLFGQSPVIVGQLVNQGQIIGNVGNTGWSLGAHLHFDLWNRNKVWDGAFYKNDWYALDPELYLSEEDDMDEAAINQLIRKAIVSHETIPHYAADAVAHGLAAHVADSSKHLTIRQITDHLIELNTRLIAQVKGLIGASGSGVSEARARAIAQDEDHKLRVTK